MKLINRDTDYSIKALRYIANRKNKIITASELVKELRIPRPFLRKILQALNRNRILKSYKGQRGGFTLVLKPNEIFLTDLIRIFHGQFEFNECLFLKKNCPDTNNCILKSKIDNIERRVIAELKSITLESLLH
ncbi:MAG: Rrf2 family transcriptional regulator [Candidatus Omnitrophota bacterium]|nr:Rrf2 family transcriptional regulator [Candidatus Omnitrophota bacterium]